MTTNGQGRNGVEILPKISTCRVGCTTITDRQTDGRLHIANVNVSSRSLTFTFAKNVRLGYKCKLADIYAFHWGELHQWLSAAAHVTCQASTFSARWHQDSSSEQCCTVFQIL